MLLLQLAVLLPYIVTPFIVTPFILAKLFAGLSGILVASLLIKVGEKEEIR